MLGWRRTRGCLEWTRTTLDIQPTLKSATFMLTSTVVDAQEMHSCQSVLEYRPGLKYRIVSYSY